MNTPENLSGGQPPPEDTIAAISTPSGEGGIGVVRLSGAEAVSILIDMFRGPAGKRRAKFETHKVNYGFVVDKDGSRIDEALVTVMLAPLTYTREDVVEISCHGGGAILRKVLGRTLELGARMALPGEFSKRAFLNGRIDLLQAEAIIDLIRSNSERSWKTAFSQLDGRLSHALEEMERDFVSLIAQIEASIDFPEEELEIAQDKELLKIVRELKYNIDNITDTYGVGRIYREGVSVVITGRPNVGKSSLMNALLERERAIVTELPGTTRDMIEESLHIDGVAIKLMDTAGVRSSDDPAEVIGVGRALEAVDSADIVLMVFDGSSPLLPEDQEVINRVLDRVGHRKEISMVVNKSDLEQKLDIKALSSKLGSTPISISAKRHDGIGRIKKWINEAVDRMGGEISEGPVLTRERHLEKLTEVKRALESAENALAQGHSREYVAADLQEAKEALDELTGRVIDDSVLEKIFSEFCIGK